MKFSDIPGHEEVKSALREMRDGGRVPHALMLSGAPGTGKMMLARAFAAYLHCERPRGGEPCGECRSCRLHNELSHPDLHFSFPIVKSQAKKTLVSADMIEPWREMLTDWPAMPQERWLSLIEAGNSQPAIHVNEAAEIIEADSYPPYSSDFKIFIMWLPEKLQLAAANKLLKVVEEPAPGTVFIFVSDNELEVLPTIYSRVRRINVGALGEEDIAAYLQRRYGLDAGRAREYARLCSGSLIRADEIGGHGGEREEFLKHYQEVMRNAYAKRVLALRKLADATAAFGREKIGRFLDYTAAMVRENFIYNMHVPALNTLTSEEEAFSTKFSPFINHRNVEGFLEETGRARRDVERNANSKIVLFDYFLLLIILLHKK